jgi:cell division transport system ATP-binding protein
MRLNKENGSAVIIVTHNREIFERYPGRVFVCKDEKCIESDNNEAIELALTF